MKQGEIFYHRDPQTASASVALEGRIGIAEATDMGEGKWIINRVNIPERDRRAGWGSKLLTKVVQEISGEAKTILVFPGGYNTPKEVLKAFYEKNGFVSNEDESIFTFTPKS